MGLEPTQNKDSTEKQCISTNQNFDYLGFKQPFWLKVQSRDLLIIFVVVLLPHHGSQGNKWLWGTEAHNALWTRSRRPGSANGAPTAARFSTSFECMAATCRCRACHSRSLLKHSKLWCIRSVRRSPATLPLLCCPWRRSSATIKTFTRTLRKL